MSQQTPYIGSRISLISKLDIRYEGVLYSVDTNESTIALAKVKSFGTEDRQPGNPIPGREDVYEYIIFKAGDIKDLLVCENPKPAAPANDGLPYDPAIITVSNAPHPGAAAETSVPQPGTAEALVPKPEKAPTPSPPVTAAPAPMGPPMPSVAPIAAPIAPVFQGPPGQRGGRGGQHPGFYPHYQRGGRGGQQSGFYTHQRGGYQVGGYHRGGRGGGHPGHPGAPGDRIRFDSDYDFEKANEQFQETLSSLTRDMRKASIGGAAVEDSSDDEIPDVVEGDATLQEPTSEDQKSYYDKKSSFFDSISCEALEKEEGKNARPDWRKERMTNQETFGHSAVRSLNYRRGGRGYGYRGNRFNGGGGGGFYHHRNNYNNYEGGPRRRF
ncbi:hypothetical protein L596_026348 [Steinernema carpocapsae]|uniref:FFD box profile domain-containing protein n=1 Tax=Steinernema carpocapsae TaxID=34508 RepID=A0A4U5M174_STECR|nr:hypothetical protein L596_026348 [Steinernema carpocapsae]